MHPSAPEANAIPSPYMTNMALLINGFTYRVLGSHETCQALRSGCESPSTVPQEPLRHILYEL